MLNNDRQQQQFTKGKDPEDQKDNKRGGGQNNDYNGENFNNLAIDARQKVNPNNLSAGQMYLSVSGVIESGHCEDEQTLQVEYSVITGEDWEVKDKTNTQPKGISQKSSSHSLYARDIVFNFPFETTLATTSAFGWPQLVLTLRGPDIFGRKVIKGYGNVHFPTQPGTHERTVRIYKPVSMSLIGGFFNFLLGEQPQYTEPEKIIAGGEGRDVTRVKSVGSVKVRFEVMKRNFQNFGYSY